jgi:hypothetical protein
MIEFETIPLGPWRARKRCSGMEDKPDGRE